MGRWGSAAIVMATMAALAAPPSPSLALPLAAAEADRRSMVEGLQAQYDIERAQDEIRAGLKKITPIVDAA